MYSVLRSIVKCLEDHMIFQKYKPDAVIARNYMFYIKIVDWKQEFFTVYEVMEEDDAAPDFTIKARNNFLSYSNRKIYLRRR